MASILLQNGTLLCHEPNDHVKAVPNTDLLIRSGKIAKIGTSLVGDASTTAIDCTGKIVSPGFVDTHHHVWQTQLKGRHSEEQLLQYLVTGTPTEILFVAVEPFPALTLKKKTISDIYITIWGILPVDCSPFPLFLLKRNEDIASDLSLGWL